MALLRAASLIASAALEASSLVWMELSMLALAGLLYALWLPRGAGREARVLSRANCEDSDTDHELKAHAAAGNHRSVLRLWQRAKQPDGAPFQDLSGIVDSMRKLGRSASQIVAELRSAVERCPGLLPAVAALPGALLRDDAVDLLDGILVLLEEHGCATDPSVYAGLMGARLRRRDYIAVATTASRVPAEALTPKMRAMLATSAAHRERLDEALGHLRHMPLPLDGSRSALSPTAVAQILALAAREQRITAVTDELQRVHARLESRHLDELLSVEGRPRGLAACKEISSAGSVLHARRSATTFQVLAGVLGQAGDGQGLCELVQELETEAKCGQTAALASEPVAIAMLEACKAVRSTSLLHRILDVHRVACMGAPGARVLSAACGTLIACERCTDACEFFEQEMLSRGLWPDAAVTSSLLKAAAHCGQTALAQRLSDHAGALRSAGSGGTAGGSSSDLQRHGTMIKAYAREGNLGSAAAVFNRLKASGATLSPLIYNCFLDACVQCGDMGAATKQFEDMKQLGFLDVVGYNTMLKAHLSRGCTEEARCLLQEMAACGVQANKVTFNELLHAKVIAKDARGVWNLVDEMQKAGVRVNSVTCSILLKSLTAHSLPSDVQRVMALIEEIEESIDEVLFSSAIEACIRIKQLDLLSDLMRRHKQKGGFRNLTAPAYGSMIKAYGQAGDITRVKELWQEMEELGVKPTAITLGCMTEALVTNNNADEAWDLVHKQFDSDERRGCINTVIYSTVLKGFAVARRMDKVMAVYKEMRGKEISCNTITYNTMLDAFAKCCAMDRASGLLEDMKESCVEPDIITYSTIIKGYCMEGDVDRAFHVLEEMKTDGKFVPDEIMYNSILDGCAKQHRVEEALRVLDEMRAANVCPSNYTLSILVKLLGHARRLNQAFRMVEDLSGQNGFRPNVQVYTCLVQACTLNRRLERALALHDTVVADVGCALDDKFYAVLARGCLQLHQPMKAAEVVRAAYQLPGHSLAAPVRGSDYVVGMEAKVLDEVAARLQAGGKGEQEALASLGADLLELRGIRLGETRLGGGAAGAAGRRSGGACAGTGRRVGAGGGKAGPGTEPWRQAGTASSRGGTR